MRFYPCFCASLCFASVLAVRGDDVAPDSDLPQPFDASVGQSLLESSPFTRSLNLSESLTLTGIAYVEGKPVATLLNRATKESFIVSEEPNAQGWKLAAATPDPALRHTQVRIMVGAELVTVRYGDEQLAPEHAKRSSSSSRPSGDSSSMYSSSKSQYKSSSYLTGDSRERYAALSEKARDMYKESMHKLIDKYPDMTPEQRSTYAEKYYARAQAEDQKQAGGDKGSRGPKVSKNSRTK